MIIPVESKLNLYITALHPCPYLPDRQAMNLLVDPRMPMNAALYGRLLDSGFRRSGDDVYRPHCRACRACISTRIPVRTFCPDRSQRRNLRRNQDVRAIVHSTGFKPEYLDMYQDYINQRHAGGGMDEESAESFANFVLSSWCKTSLVEFRREQKLLGVAAIDQLSTGVSAVYTFFDPEEGQERGLGTYALLWQIGWAKQKGLSYVYPGYWIEGSKKMDYKIRFRPIEGLVDGLWVSLPKEQKNC